MKVHLDFKNAASSAFFRVSGKTRPDKYLFNRQPGGIHRLTIDAKDLPEVARDMGLRPSATAEVLSITLEREPSDSDATDLVRDLQGQLDLAIEELKRAQQTIATLELHAPQQDETQPGRPTDEQLAMLDERDVILTMLLPLAGEADTPIDIVQRLIEGAAKPPTAGPEEPPARPELEEREAQLRRFISKAAMIQEAERVGVPREAYPEDPKMREIVAAILRHEGYTVAE